LSKDPKTRQDAKTQLQELGVKWLLRNYFRFNYRRAIHIECLNIPSYT
jgi:hypothetical protein